MKAFLTPIRDKKLENLVRSNKRVPSHDLSCDETEENSSSDEDAKTEDSSSDEEAKVEHAESSKEEHTEPSKEEHEESSGEELSDVGLTDDEHRKKPAKPRKSTNAQKFTAKANSKSAAKAKKHD